MDFKKQLNRLADYQEMCRVDGCGGTAMILQYQPLLNSNPRFFQDNPHECYVFEIGLNCGTVFSAKCVKEIRTTESEHVIYLK